MKTIVKWLNNPVVISVLLVAGTVNDLILLGRAYDLSKSDWAAWVGSFGTVATLVGTIYLARSETRRREHAEKTLARLHKRLNTPRLAVAHVAAEESASYLIRSKSDPIGGLTRANTRLADIYNWQIEELIPLAEVEGDPAGKIIEAIAELDSAKGLIDREIHAHELGVGPHRALIGSAYVALVRAERRFAEAYFICFGIPPFYDIEQMEEVSMEKLNDFLT